MAEYIKDKYLVLKTEDIAKLPNTKRVLLDEIVGMVKDVRRAEGKPGINEYYVCNITEPYSDEVWKAISEGEDRKIRPCSCGGNVYPIEAGGRWFIACAKCGKFFGTTVEFDQAGTILGFYSKDIAIRMWNEVR